MTRPEKRELERVQYWQGQTLRSQDFRGNEAVEAQRRWWHNRAEHDAYGVSGGLAPSAIKSNGRLTAILVQPGLAYDCFGRELVLEKAQIIPLPSNLPPQPAPRRASMVMLMRYRRPTSGAQSKEMREVSCTQTSPLEPGTAEFFWKPKEEVKASDGVSIAEVFYEGRKIERLNVDLFRPPTQAQARPLIVSGTTIRGKTPWHFERLGSVIELGNRRWDVITAQTMVDTSAGGFTAVPCYFAWLEGSMRDPQTGQFLPVLFNSLRNEAADSFTFAFWLLLSRKRGSFLAAVNIPPRAPQLDLYVSWIGCQMPPPIPFVPLGQRISNQSVLERIVNP